jgi:hypothetical protein
MILRRYGKDVHSVETNFYSKALTEIAFMRDHQVSTPGEEFFQAHEKLSEHGLTAQAEGDVQDEVESVMLDDLLAQLSALHESLEESQVLFIESEQGKDYPKTKTRQKNVVVEGENYLYFYSSIDPPLRVGVYRAL